MSRIGDFEGIGPVTYEVGTTDKAVAERYQELMEKLLEIFNKRGEDNPTYEYTAEDYEAMKATYEELINLAKNGLEIDGQVHYLNSSMLSELEKVLALFDAVGLTDLFKGGDANLSDAEKAAKMEEWWGFNPDLTLGILEFAEGVWVTWQSLQSQLYADYVARGNEILFGNLSELQAAGEEMQKMIDLLTELQNLSNQKEPVPPGEVPKAPDGLEGQAYVDWLKEEYGMYYEDGVLVRSTASPEDAARFQEMKGELEGIIEGLMEASGFDPENLGDDYEGSLAQQAQKLLDAMDDAGDLDTFILDEKGGDYQHILATTQTAAQTLNTQHTEDIREALYVYEEFIKSATSLMQAIQDIMKRMAQGAG